MEYKRHDNQIAVRLDRGEEIGAALLKVAKAEDIGLASIRGIGATDDVDVGVFDTDKKAYTSYHFAGTHEITSLTGNLTKKDGAPYIHLHITLAGEGGHIVGGHLLRGVVSLTAEIFITVLNGEASREFNQTLGINKIAF